MFRYGIEQMHPAAYLALAVLRALDARRRALRPGQGRARRGRDREAHRSTTWSTPTRRCRSATTRTCWRSWTASSRRASTRGAAVGHSARSSPSATASRSIDDAPHGHTRKARYIRGKTGVVEMAHGTMIYPDSAGNGGPEAPEHVYTVSSPTRSSGAPRPPSRTASSTSTSGSHLTSQEPRPAHESPVAGHSRTQEEIAARVKAMESIMIEKGIMTTAAIDRLAEIYETRGRTAARRRGRREGVDRPRVQGAAAGQRHRGVRRAGHRRAAGRGHGRRREHRHRAQRDHLHAVLLLPVAGARAAAELVQGPRVPLADRARAAEGAARGLRPRRARLGRGARVGLLVGDALLGASAASGGHRGARSRRRSPRSSRATR